MTPLPTMTVGQLITALQKFKPDDEVKVWLPGTKIKLHQAFCNGKLAGVVFIEGNIEPGSALGD